jgi:hypothetical protein
MKIIKLVIIRTRALGSGAADLVSADLVSDVSPDFALDLILAIDLISDFAAVPGRSDVEAVIPAQASVSIAPRRERVLAGKRLRLAGFRAAAGSNSSIDLADRRQHTRDGAHGKTNTLK